MGEQREGTRQGRRLYIGRWVSGREDYKWMDGWMDDVAKELNE